MLSVIQNEITMTGLDRSKAGRRVISREEGEGYCVYRGGVGATQEKWEDPRAN